MYLTDADLSKDSICNKVGKAIHAIKAKLISNRKRRMKTLTTIEIVLDSDDFEKDWTEWIYYCVDKKAQHLFWLDDHILEPNIDQGAESEAHVGELSFLGR